MDFEVNTDSIKWTRLASAFAAALMSAACAMASVSWENVDEGHYIAGRRCSEGYLQGKVVLVSRDPKMAQRMEEIWTSFKTKPFVLIGSHRGTAGAEKIKRIAEGLKLTFPIYKEADIVRTEEQKKTDPVHIGFMYIIGGTGRILYCGTDDRRASGVIASALISMRSPTTVKQWKHYIDHDIKVLPGKAYVEIEEFRKTHPKEAAAYDEVWAKFNEDSEIRRVAKLERIAQQAKDYDFKDANAKRLNLEKVEKAIELSADLKKSENPFVAQEAKNCIADLTWTAAMLKPAESSKKQGEK